MNKFTLVQPVLIKRRLSLIDCYCSSEYIYINWKIPVRFDKGLINYVEYLIHNIIYSRYYAFLNHFGGSSLQRIFFLVLTRIYILHSYFNNYSYAY